jgi:hypothetical protein
MCPTNIIMYVSYRSIKGVIFVVPCSDRYRCFITPQDYWYKRGAVRLFVLGNDVLTLGERQEQRNVEWYALLATKPSHLRKSLVITAHHLLQTPGKVYDSQTPHQNLDFPPAHRQQQEGRKTRCRTQHPSMVELHHQIFHLGN